MSHPAFSAFRRSRWCRWLVWAAAVFLAYVLIGFFVLPPVIKWQMLKRLPGITKRQAAIRQVKFNPLALSLTIRGLALTEPDGRPFASWEELYVNFQASSLFRWAWTFDEIRLVKPVGEILLLKDGRLNFANMLESRTNAPPPPSSRPAAIPRINIFRLEITNGFVDFEDRTRRSAFHTEYRPINLRLQHFSTQPNSDTPYSFRAESDAGRSVTWAGDLWVEPLRSSGHLELTGIRLSRYQPYFEEFTRAVLTNGLADVKLSYQFEVGTNGTQLLVTNGALHVEQVAVLDPETSETVAGLRGLDVTKAEFNLREGAARVGEVKVSEASLLTRLKKGGHVNLLDLLTLPPAATNAATAASARSAPPHSAPAPAVTVTVDAFTIEKTAVSFEDLTLRTPFRTELKPIGVSVKRFTTRPDSDAAYSFQLASEAAEKFEGAGSFSINPIRSGGEIRIATVDVKKYLPYVEGLFRGKITSGKIEARVPYRFALATNTPLAGVTNLAVKLTDLEVLMPENGEQVTHVAEVSLEGVEASLEDRRARVGLLKADGGSVLLRREKDGALNVLGLLAAWPTNTPTAPAASAGSPTGLVGSAPEKSPAPANGGWVVNLDELALDNYTVKIEDRQPAKPAVFLLDRLALNLKGASTITSAPITASVSLRFNETGTIAAQGTVKLMPLSAVLDVAATNLDLRAAQPYLDPFVRLNLVSGGLTVTGKAAFQPHAAPAPMLTFKGAVGLTNFVTTDQVMFKEFARWDDLNVSGIDFACEPNRLKVGEVKFVRLHGNLVIGADHRPNFALIMVSQEPSGTNAAPGAPAASPPSVAAKPAAEAFPVELGTLALDRASFGFTDESIQPHASLDVEELSGTIKGLSSAMDTTAAVDLAGKVNAQSPFAISGRANPLSRPMFVDLVFSNANTQLTPLTSYMEKYGGHPLTKGRLSTTLRYHIEGKALTAENKVRIDQLTLGPRNSSPDATKLPVKLGVALLKDSHGAIELDVPVKGRLDDPQFKVGPIILKVIMNMLTKAATSPFSLLGALVGGGEELSYVEFSPGTTNVATGELEKLAKLGKALTNRPALSVEIEGAIDPAGDREALSLQKLHDQFKAQRLRELKAKGKAPESAEGFVIDPENYDRLLRAAFAAQFGTNISVILRTNQVSSTTTNKPPSHGLLKTTLEAGEDISERVIAVVGLGSYARKSTAEKHLSKVDRIALEQLTPALMESLLADHVAVSNDDYRRLMEARARWVQDWLSQNGGVAADRMLLVAPKTVDAAYQGQARANLTLN